MRTDIRNREAGSAEQIAQRQAWEQRAEIQIIQHRSAEGIEIELEEAAELQPRNIDRHRAFDFARDAARSDDQRAAAAGELHELIRAVAERQRHIACRDGDGRLAGGVRGFAEREITRERLAEDGQFQSLRLEARHGRRGVVTHNHFTICVRDGQRLVDDLAGIVHAHERRAGRRHAVHTDDAHRARGDQRVGEVRRTEANQSHAGICDQHAHRDGIQLAVRQTRRTLADEDFQSLAREDGVSVHRGESDIAFDGDEVADVQREVFGEELEEARLAFSELHAQRPAIDDNRLVDGRARVVDAETGAPRKAHAADIRRRRTAHHAGNSRAAHDEESFRIGHTERVAAIGERDRHFGERDARHLRRVRERGLVEDKVTNETVARDGRREIRRAHAQERTGRNVEDHGRSRADAEGLIHRCRARVQAQAEAAGHARVAGERHRRCRIKRRRHAQPVDEQCAGSARHVDDGGAAVLDLKREAVDTEADHRFVVARGGKAAVRARRGRLFHREGSAECLAEHRHRDTTARRTHEAAGRVGCIHFDGQRAAEREARNVRRHIRQQATDDARLTERKGRRALADGDEVVGAVAEREREVIHRDADRRA